MYVFQSVFKSYEKNDILTSDRLQSKTLILSMKDDKK